MVNAKYTITKIMKELNLTNAQVRYLLKKYNLNTEKLQYDYKRGNKW